MPESARAGQYNENFNVALQWMWGDGFLSPGGKEEVYEMLKGIDVEGKHVLDVGCGLGAADVLLIQSFGAARVTGIDVEPHLIEACRARARDNGVSSQTDFVLVEPGPLPFEASSFDIVFSKDAIVHIPDKPTFYADVFEKLRPGGLFVGSDWLRGGEDTATEAALAWLSYVHLNFQMSEAPAVEATIRAAGFDSVRLNDRNAWYQEEIKRELESLEGESFEKLASMIGAEAANYRLENSTMKRHAIDDGFLRPTHIVASKPA